MPKSFCNVFTSLWRSIQTMSCFFDCFRIRHTPSRRPSQFITKEEVGEKINVASLFTAKDTRKCNVDQQPVYDEELLEEAKFLKACGTLPDTPAEIQKVTLENFGEEEVHKPKSMLNSSVKTPSVIQQADIVRESLDGSHSSTSPNSIEYSPDEIQNTQTCAEILQKFDSPMLHTVVKSSPYPTPRRITDDMQTPGTVFATNMKNLAKGNLRIRSQYVYTALNPIENLIEHQELKENNCVNQKEYLSELGCTPYPAVSRIRDSSEKENFGDASLSSWLKPSRANNDASCHKLGGRCSRKNDTELTTREMSNDGLFATQWNHDQEETSHNSPKLWVGNGIPNTTTKYKEDQKVRWHATPFEKRLEKAMLEEEYVPPRKPSLKYQ